MTAHTTSTQGRRPGRMAVALASLTAFGCTTIRAPAGAIAPAIPVEDGRPAPQVELWLESGRPVGPQEAVRARAEVDAALRDALARRQPGDGDQLLVVRAQGVSRTASHRTDQKAAVAGIVVGAVAVVAVVVLAVVAGKGSGGGKGGGGAVKAGGRPGGWAGGHGGGVRPAPPGAGHALPVPRPPRPGPGLGSGPVAGWRPSHRSPPHTGVWIGWSAEVRVPSAPVEVMELEPVPLPDRQPPWTWEPAPLGDLAAAPEAEEPEPADTIWLPPLPPLELDERGFFAGDLTRLELTLVDRLTGRPLWVKRVEKEVDPRDPRAVRALLDGALDDTRGWVAASH